MILKLLRNSNIDFSKYYVFSFLLSGIVMITSLVYFFFQGLNFGIDFEGGYLFDLRSKNGVAVNVDQVREILLENGFNEAGVQGNNFGGASFKISHMASQEAIEKIKSDLSTKCENSEIDRFELIGPKISKELVLNGILAVFFGMLAIFLYVWMRYKWEFGIAAILSLINDCFFVFFLFSVLRFEFNETAIVAFLITISYSINDTVVIFDRIQDNIGIYKNFSIKELINKSLNSTLSRTVMTSFTTLLSLLVLYFFGGEVIKKFSLPIIVGIIAGTYSSIFLAAPLWGKFHVRRKGGE